MSETDNARRRRAVTGLAVAAEIGVAADWWSTYVASEGGAWHHYSESNLLLGHAPPPYAIHAYMILVMLAVAGAQVKLPWWASAAVSCVVIAVEVAAVAHNHAAGVRLW